MAEIEKEEAAERGKDPFFAVMSDIYKLEKEYERKSKRSNCEEVQLEDGRVIPYVEAQKIARQSIGKSVVVARAYLKNLEKNLDTLNNFLTQNP